MGELIHIATCMGIRVHFAHIDNAPELNGYFLPRRRIIVIRITLTPVEKRSVLAHELAHAYYGDACSDGPEERRAQRHAAMLLITPEAYAAAEAIDPHPAAIAEELGVTLPIVTAYREQCLQRLGNRTYGVSPRAGLHGDRAIQLSS